MCLNGKKCRRPIFWRRRDTLDSTSIFFKLVIMKTEKTNKIIVYIICKTERPHFLKIMCVCVWPRRNEYRIKMLFGFSGADEKSKAME